MTYQIKKIPRYSFIIPVRNGEKTIQNTLKSIVKQKSNHEFEIIVVNNKSTDKTEQILSNFDVLILDEEKIGRSFARNTGLSFSRGKWICFIDSDVILEDDWLIKQELKLDDEVVDVLSGKIIPQRLDNSLFSSFREEFQFHLTSGTYNLLDREWFTAPMVNTAACIIKKEILIKINGFDININSYEDFDLSLKLWREGAVFYAVPNIRAEVFWEKGHWWSYLKRYFHLGRGISLIRKKWDLKNASGILPTWGRFPFSSWKFNLFDFLIQLFTTFGSLTIYQYNHEKITLSKKDKKTLKKIYLQDFVIIISADTRMIFTSKNLIFKELNSKRTLQIPLNYSDEKQDKIRDLLIRTLIDNESAHSASDFFIIFKQDKS